MKDIVIIGTALIFTIVIRYASVWANRGLFTQGFYGDSSDHYNIIRHLKKNFRLNFINQYLISDEPISYPLGFHRYGVLFPLRWLERWPYLPNAVLICLFTGAFLAYVRLYLGSGPAPEFVAAGPWIALLAVISVSNLAFYGPAIAYLTLSERLLARLSTSAYFVLLAAGLTFDDRASLAAAVIFGAIALTSSKFARQALLFPTPIFMVLAGAWWPLATLLGAIALALAVSGWRFVHSLRFQILHLLSYWRTIRHSRSTRPALSRVIDFSRLLRGGLRGRTVLKELIGAEPTRSLFSYPEYFLMAVAPVIWPEATEGLGTLWALLAASAVVYLATSTRWLHHLGESYRYLEYNLTFIAPVYLGLLLSRLPMKEAAWVAGLLIAVTLVFAFGFITLTRRARHPRHDELAAFLAPLELRDEDVVFPISMRLGADICARAPCKSFWWQPGNVSGPIFDRFLEEYPFLKKDWNELFASFGVTHVICDKQALENLGRMDWSYDFSGLTPLAESARYTAYTVPADYTVQAVRSEDARSSTPLLRGKAQLWPEA